MMTCIMATINNISVTLAGLVKQVVVFLVNIEYATYSVVYKCGCYYRHRYISNTEHVFFNAMFLK